MSKIETHAGEKVGGQGQVKVCNDCARLRRSLPLQSRSVCQHTGEHVNLLRTTCLLFEQYRYWYPSARLRSRR